MNLLLCLLLLQNPVGDLSAGHAALAAGDRGQARALYERALADPAQKPEALIALCQLLTTPEEADQAVPYGEQAVAAAPDSARAHYHYALALLTKAQSGNPLAGMPLLEIFRAEIRRAVELDPQFNEARELEITFYMRAPEIAGGSESKALELAEAFTAVHPGLGRLAQARILRRQERSAEALAVLTEAERHLPNHPELIYLKGILQFRLEDYAGAIQTFDRGPAPPAPFGGQILYQRARARIFAKLEPEQAIALTKAYIQVRPSLSGPELPSVSSGYWRLGQAYELSGDRDKAREAYTTGAALPEPDPHNQEALALLDKR